MNTNVPTSFAHEIAQGNVKKAMAGISSGDLWKVPVDQLHILPGFNVRTKSDEYEAHIDRIAKSIFNEGFYPDKALSVFIDDRDRVCLRDGHSRYEATLRAIKMGAQITTLPCVTAPRGSTMEDYTIGLVKSNEGKPLAPIEVAVVCKRLTGWGWDEQKIADRLDYTKQYVVDLLNLLSAPAALQQLVSAGKISASTAIKTSKKEGVAKATETLLAASKAAKGGKVTAKTLKPAKPAAKAEDLVFTAPYLKAALKRVFDDPGFNKLSDKTQSYIIDIVG
jgi:hypothetical protein